MTEIQCERCGSKRVEIINRDGKRRAQCLECAWTTDRLTDDRYIEPTERRLRFLESEIKRHADTILKTMDRIDSLSDTVSRLLARIEQMETDLGNVTERVGYLDGGAFPPEDFQEFMENRSINKAEKPK